MREVINDRDRKPPIVDTVVGVERAIFGVDGRALELDADLAQPDHGPVLVIQGLDLVAVAVEDTAGLRELRSLQLVDRGQVAGEVVDHRNGGHTAQETDRADREERDQGCAREPAARHVPPASCAGTRSDPVLQRSR